ncbi:MAG: glycosyltransferase family 4 protein [Bryobacteraceae bacterium]|nr:glycosyltransferase family 4 protein [Bryobacteraceae bacterium]
MPVNPRVLFVIPGEEAGSSMIFAKRQAAAVSALVPVRCFFLRSRTCPWLIWKDLVRFRQVLCSWKPDLVHAQYGTVTAAFAAISSRKPLVITFRGSDLNPCPSMNRIHVWFSHLLSQLAALRARRLIVVSPELADRLWLRGKTATVLPSGVDTTQFFPGPRDAARRVLGWSSEPVVVFHAGRNPAVKRLDLARAAIDEARRTMPDLRLEVLSGHHDPAVVPDILRAADCLLLTSDYEGSPTIIQEALACNLPVVAVPVGDVPTRLRGVSECEVAPRDARELAKAVIRVVRAGRRSDGATKAMEISTIAIAHKLVDLYEQVALRRAV